MYFQSFTLVVEVMLDSIRCWPVQGWESWGWEDGRNLAEVSRCCGRGYSYPAVCLLPSAKHYLLWQCRHNVQVSPQRLRVGMAVTVQVLKVCGVAVCGVCAPWAWTELWFVSSGALQHPLRGFRFPDTLQGRFLSSVRSLHGCFGNFITYFKIIWGAQGCFRESSTWWRREVREDWEVGQRKSKFHRVHIVVYLKSYYILSPFIFLKARVMLLI